MNYSPRTIPLLTDTQKQTAILALQNAPTGQNLEVVIREVKKQRNNVQNNLLWAAMDDISQQLWLNGKQYSIEIIHEHMKQEFMPDETTEPYIHEHVIIPESYCKWEFMPNGARRCTASTTQLTKYGFSQYIEQIFAFGSSYGVMFTTKER